MPSITMPDTPGTHRFRDFYKSEHYAFARGLSISPVHLPLALEAMREDGWQVLCVFGETTSESVGFLFERKSDG